MLHGGRAQRPEQAVVGEEERGVVGVKALVARPDGVVERGPERVERQAEGEVLEVEEVGREAVEGAGVRRGYAGV